jgi:hypothetical protein
MAEFVPHLITLILVLVILVLVQQTILVTIVKHIRPVVLQILARIKAYVLTIIMVINVHVPLDMMAIIVKLRSPVAFPPLVSIWELLENASLGPMGTRTVAFVLQTFILQTAPLEFQTMHMIATPPLWRILLVSEEMVSVSSIGPTSKRQPLSVATSWHPQMSMVVGVVELL